MSTAKWKFSLWHSNDMTGDLVEALCASGFGVLESETVAEAVLETTELAIAIRKDSNIDPRQLLQNLRNIGMGVQWLNEPAA
jgi:hypothetical protein